MIKRRVGLVYWDTGFGIERDATIISNIVENLGYRVRRIRTTLREDLNERRVKFALQAWKLAFPSDLQIHLEQNHREQFRLGKRNLWFPNTEFTDPNVFDITPNLSRICCKTHHAFGMIKPLFTATDYTGFTSVDCFHDYGEKDYNRIFHLAGKSDFKGTEQLLNAWRRHPEWPKLVIVRSPKCTFGLPRKSLGEIPSNVELIQEFVPDEELSRLQNEIGIHLCPSETEGFGHYINEARSTGAVVITTKAPPMEEFVDENSGFVVEANPFRRQCMNDLYAIRVESLENTMQKVLETPVERLVQMGKNARALYLSEGSAFDERASKLIRSMLDAED